MHWHIQQLPYPTLTVFTPYKSDNKKANKDHKTKCQNGDALLFSGYWRVKEQIKIIHA